MKLTNANNKITIHLTIWKYFKLIKNEITKKQCLKI